MTERRETGRSKKHRSRHKPRHKPNHKPTATDTADGERIAKYLARCGVASRRASEALIADGKVFVNGERLITPAVKVTGREDIRVAGKRIRPPDPTRLWRYHKPSGLITTNSDPAGRRTIFDELPKSLPRTMTVGRLDLNTEGLLLLTNNGELARAMELPNNGMERSYRARAHGEVSEEQLASLGSGITVDGETFGAIRAELERTMGHNSWIKVTLNEGKKREVRRALEAIGLKVNRLIRTDYGPFELGELRPGSVKEVPSHRVLKELAKVHPPLENELTARSRFERPDKSR
ncbi:MAG: pseudouridine synthase [Pseudomonadota bacterium]